MRKPLFALAVAGTAALAVAGSGAGATTTGTSYQGIDPVSMSGNPKCADLPNFSFTTQVVFDPPVNGSAAGGIYILVNSDGYGWYVDRGTLDVLVKAVIVKGGTGANVYYYPTESTGPEPYNGLTYADGQLVAPQNAKSKKGGSYDLGTLTFCY